MQTDSHHDQLTLRQRRARVFVTVVVICGLSAASIQAYRWYNLRQAVAMLRKGDSMHRALVLLGEPRYWSHNCPPVGVAPSQFGLHYSTPLSELHELLDSLVVRVCHGTPAWYSRCVMQRHSPIDIRYNVDGIITRVAH